MLQELTRDMLWEARAQFGHNKQIWCPKMKPYIYGTKKNLYILNLEKTLVKIAEAKEFITELANNKSKILFVGTKNQAKWVIQDAAVRSGNFYVTERWLGGTLTNLRVINFRVKRLWEITRDIKLGKMSLLPKKEQLKIMKEKEKLEKLFTGIKGMRQLPKALFVIDPGAEKIAVQEARKLNIPIIGICDTSSNPDVLDYVIPANDDYYKSIELITNYLVDHYGFVMGVEFEPPQEKPQELIDRDTAKKHRSFERHSFHRYSNNYSNNSNYTPRSNENKKYEPIVPLNVNKKEFLKNKVVLNYDNYKTLIAEGKSSPTAKQAARLVNFDPNCKLYTYEEALLNYWKKQTAEKPVIKPEVVATEELTLTTTTSGNNSLLIDQINILDNDLELSLSTILMKDLRLIAKELNVATAAVKKVLIANIATAIEIKDNKLVRK